MGSETPLKLPFIDLSNLDKNTNNVLWDATKTQVHQALTEFGCFEATFANIPLTLQTSMFDSLKQLFDLPLQTKLKNRSSKSKPFHGYVGQDPKKPLYESMAVEAAHIPDKAESFAKILWPEGNPKFCNTIQEYADKLLKLDQMVRKMVLESLGLEKYMDEHMESTFYVLRFNRYAVPEIDESNLGVGSHTDTNFLTILQQFEVDGLELQDRSGDWIKFQPSVPNSLVVMNGDSFNAWTNGRLHPPFHRVIMSGNKPRYSLAFFASPKNGYMVKAPEELVDEEHPLLFKPYDIGEFIQFYDAQVHESLHAALKIYCAV